MSSISELPEDERPREKLAKWGAESLSNAELLAIFLRVGVQGQSAIAIAQELLNTHGNLRSLGRSSVKEIAKQHGIGPAKAAQIAAAFELGARSAKEQITNASIASPYDIYKFMRPILDYQSHERLYVLLANTKLHHIRTIEISHGSINSTHYHPRDILHHVILHEAWGFVLVHNHPTGNPAPSTADISMTEHIVKAAELMQTRCIDHIIIGAPSSQHQSYYSFRESGLIT